MNFLDALMKKCHEVTDEHLALYWTMRAKWITCDVNAEREFYEKQKQEQTISDELFFTFCMQVGGALPLSNEVVLAEQMLNEVVERDTDINRIASAYYSLAVCKNVVGDHLGTFERGEAAARYVQAYPECNKGNVFQNLALFCGCNLQFQKQKEGKELLEKLEELYDEQLSVALKMQYLDLQTVYYMNHGSLEKALEYVQQTIEIVLLHEGEGFNYYAMMGKSAIILQRLKRYEESEKRYLYLIQKVQEEGIDHFYQSFNNNISVLYLEMEKPRKALEHLDKAEPLAKQYGGLMLGEFYRNRARAYGQLKQYEKEYENVKEASPLLDAVYGTEHERSVAARERLLELSKILGHKIN